MDLIELLSFGSAKERRKRQREYFKKVFPLGEEQREWEKNMVDKIFSYIKEKNRKNYIFELLVLKEKLYIAENPDEEEEIIPRELVLKKWKKKRVNIQIKDGDCAILQAMAVLQHDAKSLETLPTRERILLKAKEYE